MRAHYHLNCTPIQNTQYFTLKKNNKWSEKHFFFLTPLAFIAFSKWSPEYQKTILLWSTASSWTWLKNLWLQRCAGVKQLFSGNMLPSVMERYLWVRRPSAVQTAHVTVLCFRKQDLEIKRAWRLLWIAPSRIRRNEKNQAMKENMGMVLQEWTQRTLHQKNKLKVYCKVDLLLFVLLCVTFWLQEKNHWCSMVHNF